MGNVKVALGLALAVLVLGGCTQPSLIKSAAESPLRVTDSLLSTRGSAPFTRRDVGSPGALLSGAQSSATIGRQEAYGKFTLTTERAEGAVVVDARMIDPARIPGIPQRYKNDCAQAALAMVLDFYQLQFAEADTYDAVAAHMAPMAWGTRIEDVTGFFDKQEILAVTPVRQASVSYLENLLAQGKPVPVVLSVSTASTTMHYVVVIGTGTSRNGERYVLYKDPAQTEADKVVVLDEATFLAAWENEPIRGSWWSGLASFVANTQPANYERVAFDIGFGTN